METTATERYAALIEGASKSARERSYGYGIYTDGAFQVYAVPVTSRTARRAEHYRFTYYLQQGPNGSFYRTNKTEFMRRLEGETRSC